MPNKIDYRESLWEIYARAVSLITIIVIVAAFVMGGRDFVKLAFPKFTLNASLHEKYKNNESFSDFGTFHKKHTQEQITHKRVANYDKLLRMERRGAVQNLIYVGMAMLAVALLNGILVFANRFRRKHMPDEV